MNIFLSELAPQDLPRIEYATVDDDQAGHISEAMTLPENQEKFDVTFIPIDTPEARKTAALEWAAYVQAKGAVAAREQGAIAIFTSRDQSPEAYERTLEKHLNKPEFAAHALLKVVLKTDDAKSYDLMRTYYEPESK